ncbi:MAG: hypothetical protein SH850_05945 [Planctomycetaceae bacterium]|nr:hypothetical protein [Planctomycetaceae bacterium]
MSCPVPPITEEQRSALKPWAIGVFVSQALVVASWALLAVYSRVIDFRVFCIWFSLPWLAARGYEDLCERRMVQIIGESWSPPTGRVRLHRRLSFRRVMTAVMLTILVVSVVTFFL